MAHGLSILIVDPDQAFSASLEAVLRREGHECQAVTTADRALEVVAAGWFDVMLTSMLLPDGVTGSHLVRRVKKMAPGIGVIAMTDNVEHFPYDSAVEAGAADFITKPFATHELLHRLKHVIHQETLRLMSVTDELTGLFNRRGFYTLAEQQLKLSRRQQRGIYMLYADVDGLKGINDGFGHQEGDRALIDVANLLKHTYRESDIIARIGGDEFIVVPVGCSGDDMSIIIARLIKNLDEFNAKEGRLYKIRVSVGISYYDPANQCSIDELLSSGDRSMYEDKKRKQKPRVEPL